MNDTTEYNQLNLYNKISININLFVLDVYFTIKNFICKSN